MEEPVLHLASSSQRRRDILKSLGIKHSFAGVDIDEMRHNGEAANDLVIRLARQKAHAADVQKPVELPILAADTVVVVDDRVFGKPTSEDHAVAMLTALSGRSHRVMTAVALRMGNALMSDMSVTEVQFRNIRSNEARAYWQSGEPAGKAGAYAIQGYGGIFVEKLTGSYSGVVGLPVFETAALLELVGVSVLREVPKL